ncbi:MAG: fumarate reductase subunit C, partial [Pseudolabrys sp.]
YDAWFNFLTTPWSLALHLLFLIGMIAHAWTWFQIMPKTMPRLVIGGRVVPQNWISAAGLALAMAAFIIILLVAEWMQP